MVFLVMGRGAENIEKKNKTDRKKTLKNENKVERRIQGKSNNNNEHLWFYLLLKSIVVRGKKVKSSLYHQILFTVFKCCRIRSNDTPKLNIHKYNDNTYNRNIRT